MNDETKTPTELELEQLVQDAMFGEGTIPLTLKFGDQELHLSFRWPDMTDEQEIDRLTVVYCNGYPMEAVPDAAYELARSRALIEVLAEGPFEQWLPPTSEKVTFKGKKALRPDTSQVKSRALLVGFAREWNRIYIRHQALFAL